MTAKHPFTSFEEYMLHDDRMHHPMVFFLRADLQGEVQEAKFRSAFDEVVRRHPIFWSKIIRQGRKGIAWQPDPKRIPSLQVQSTDTMGKCPESYIDLETQPGLRTFLNLGSAAAELWLQFHHSCCDGLAGVGFLYELIEAYGRRTSRLSAAPLPVSDAFPANRCAYSLLTRREKTDRLLRDLSRILTFFGHRLMSPLKSTSQSETAVRRPAYLEARLPLTASTRARLKRVHPLPASVNDILLRDVYLALTESMKEYRSLEDSDWIRIAVPTNLRKPGVPVTGCSNDVSMAFLDRQVGQVRRKGELLNSISREMTQVKQYQMGHTMLRALNWLRHVPGGLSGAIAFQRSHATAVVSNLGEVFGALTQQGRVVTDDITITKLGFLVPIREGTPISFAVLTYADELTLCMQYDPHVITHESAEKLLSTVVSHMRDSLAEDATKPTEVPLRRAA